MGGFVARTLLAVCLLATAFPAHAADFSVDIFNFSFDPEELTIDPGDRITWTNLDPVEHTVTSESGLWDSGLLDTGETYTLVLNDPGTYRYVCIPHPGMDGLIIVRGGGTTPGAPASIDASPGLLPGYTSVRWSPPDDDGGSPVLRYQLCKGTAPGQTNECYTVIGTSLEDPTNTPLQEIYYVVHAVNSFGMGPPSAETCATAGPWLELLDC